MKLLILGGTVFLGRHIAAAALARGHDVTLFTRGQHNPDLFPEAEKLRGDRAGDLGALAGRRWDAVIDTSGYIPRAVRRSAEALADAVEHYTFISSISVYAHPWARGMDEGAPLATIDDPATEEVTGETYGALKALCERAAEAAMPGRVLVVRPGLIVGPHDPTDRFTYWPVRAARGGEMLAPGDPAQPVQLIDARDLAAWTLDMAERRATGTFNATGPEAPLSMEAMLEGCVAAAGSAATLTWVEEGFLLEQGAQPWGELPLWLPSEDATLHTADVSKAVAAGLRFRSLAETARDTLDWHATRPADEPLRAGLSAEREGELLAAWHARER